jgi:hypothetical protein
MKIKDMKPANLLFPDESNCFQIPPFQRAYVWPLDRVHRLVRDIARAALTQNESGHWLGVILLAHSDRKCDRSAHWGHECWDILDGQQRSISLRLWLAALNDEFERQYGTPMAGLSRERLTNIRVHSLNEMHWKIVMDQRKLISQRESHMGSDDANAILRTYWYFRWLLLNGLDGLDPEREEHLPCPKRPSKNKNSEINEMSVLDYWLFKKKDLRPLDADYLTNLARATADRLTLAAMQHEQQKDESVEEIFETLNAERTELGQFDLARNFFFISLQTGGAEQKRVYDDYFFKAEESLRNADLDLRRDPLDLFLYDYLGSTGKFDSGLGLSNTAASLKSKWRDINREPTVMRFLTERLTPAMYAWIAIRSGSEVAKAMTDTSTTWASR